MPDAFLYLLERLDVIPARQDGETRGEAGEDAGREAARHD
jgi:hypothetical protein